MWLYYISFVIGMAAGAFLMWFLMASLKLREASKLLDLLDAKERENMNLQLDLKFLKMDLENERYRHARVQDFCVKVCDQLDEARGISYAENA